ncbi:MAG: cytochrome c3 family protein [Gammaproteobacteria bacterium]|nr:cytochrome c3 family protein [Gammaproteobacteria bacterium]
MPGELTRAHAENEADCDACHRSFDRVAERKLCLDCHDMIADDEQLERGFHGRDTQVSNAPCRDCHTEHRGREADILGLDPETFDHRRTGLELQGAHRRLPCRACHEEPGKWRLEAIDCRGCHSARDVHSGELGADCAACHRQDNWRLPHFDHDTTNFKLLGVHGRVPCARCHTGSAFNERDRGCIGCHAGDDTHHGALGEKCADCHNSDKWKDGQFDHDRDTKWPLKKKHRDLRCSACHRQPGATLATGCRGCHESQDVHRGRLGPKCGDCHDASGWKAAGFDHGKTRFPLKGQHQNLACEACHSGDGADTPSACIACHKSKDVHAGSLGENCAGCHSSESWDRARFDHELTSFPLLGLHALAACESCHVDARFSGTEKKCGACHQDEHQGRLGTDCGGCHNPNSWARWIFDHDARTSFSLTGAHLRTRCEACHRDALQDTGGQCIDCHRGDDLHQGRFGRDCGRCHSTERFGDVRVN